MRNKVYLKKTESGYDIVSIFRGVKIIEGLSEFRAETNKDLERYIFEKKFQMQNGEDPSSYWGKREIITPVDDHFRRWKMVQNSSVLIPRKIIHHYLDWVRVNSFAEFERISDLLYEFALAIFDLEFSNFSIETISGYIIERFRSCPKKEKYAAMELLCKPFDWALERGYIYGSIKRNQKVGIPGTDIENVFTKEEIDILFNSLGEGHPLFNPLCLAFHTGLRKEELVQLKWDNIDFVRKEILVPPTKDRDSSIVTLNKTIMDLLKIWLRRCESFNTFTDPKELENEFKTAQVIILKKIPLPFDAIRHTIARFLIFEGCPLFEVSKLLRHSSIHMTKKIYRCFVDAAHERTANRLDSVFWPIFDGRCD